MRSVARLIPVALLGACTLAPWNVDDPWQEVLAACGERDPVALWANEPLDLSPTCVDVVLRTLHVDREAWRDASTDEVDAEIAVAEAIYALGAADAGRLSELEEGGFVDPAFIAVMEREARFLGVADAPVGELLFRHAARVVRKLKPFTPPDGRAAQYNPINGHVAMDGELSAVEFGDNRSRMFLAGTLIHEARHPRGPAHVRCSWQENDERPYCDPGLNGSTGFEVTWFALQTEPLMHVDVAYAEYARAIAWVLFERYVEGEATSVSPLQPQIDAQPAGAVYEVPDGVHEGTLTLDRAITLRGSPDAVLRSRWGPAVHATAPVTVEGLTVDGGFDPRAWAIVGESSVALIDVSLLGTGGPAAVRSDGDLTADGVVAALDMPGDGLQMQGTGTLIVRDSVLATPSGTPVLAHDAGAIWFERVDLHGSGHSGGGNADTGAAVALEVGGTGSLSLRGNYIELVDIDLPHTVYARGLEVSARDIRGGFVSIEAGNGWVEDVATGSLFLSNVDFARVLVSGPYPGIDLHESAGRSLVLRSAQMDAWTWFSGRVTIDGMLVEDRSGGGPWDRVAIDGDIDARVELSHLTWLGGDRRHFGADGADVHLTDSLIAGLRLREFDWAVTTDNSFGWGDDLPVDQDEGAPPWPIVTPQLDGLDLAADSPLLGERHPGALGSEYADEIVALWESAE